MINHMIARTQLGAHMEMFAMLVSEHSGQHVNFETDWKRAINSYSKYSKAFKSHDLKDLEPKLLWPAMSGQK